MGFPVTTERAQFIEEVLLVAEEMVFPVDRKNALSLVQLTLGILDKRSKELDDPVAFIKRVLRRHTDSGRDPKEEVEYARLDF